MEFLLILDATTLFSGFDTAQWGRIIGSCIKEWKKESKEKCQQSNHHLSMMRRYFWDSTHETQYSPVGFLRVEEIVMVYHFFTVTTEDRFGQE